MNEYQKCPDCGLIISINADVCPFCARGFQGVSQKFISYKKTMKRNKPSDK